MARRLWGCYSVADHLEERAFVADLLLYDRLIVPTPARDDLERWEKHWDPERQERLLDILGPHAERVEWSAQLREQWEKGYASISQEAQQADSAYAMTRRVILEELLEKETAAGNDVRAVAVYATPDHFDREWRLKRSPRFVRRETTVTPGKLTEAYRPQQEGMHELAKLVVTQLVVPDGGRTDEEVLTLTVDLVSKKGISELRAQLHEAIASVKEDGVRDETVVAEIDEMLRAFNEAVAKKTNGSVARTCLTGLSWAAGGFALWCPPVGALVGPAAKLGDVVVTKVFGGEEPAKGSGLELLAAAQKALAAD